MSKDRLKEEVFTRSAVSLSRESLWVFPKIGVSQNGWFVMVPNPIKMDDLGVPLFLETPISSKTRDDCFNSLLDFQGIQLILPLHLVSISRGYATGPSLYFWRFCKMVITMSNEKGSLSNNQ